VQTVASYPLSDDATTAIDAVVVMKQSAGPSSPDGAMFKLSGAWCRDSGGAPVQIKAPAIVDSNQNSQGPAWTAVLALSGNNVEVNTTTDATKAVTITVTIQATETLQLGNPS
jgi:hypothetical protein